MREGGAAILGLGKGSHGGSQSVPMLLDPWPSGYWRSAEGGVSFFVATLVNPVRRGPIRCADRWNPSPARGGGSTRSGDDCLQQVVVGVV